MDEANFSNNLVLIAAGACANCCLSFLLLELEKYIVVCRKERASDLANFKKVVHHWQPRIWLSPACVELRSSMRCVWHMARGECGALCTVHGTYKMQLRKLPA